MVEVFIKTEVTTQVSRILVNALFVGEVLVIVNHSHALDDQQTGVIIIIIDMILGHS